MFISADFKVVVKLDAFVHLDLFGHICIWTVTFRPAEPGHLFYLILTYYFNCLTIYIWLNVSHVKPLPLANYFNYIIFLIMYYY